MTNWADHERPIFFGPKGEELFGILTHPNAPARDVGILMLWGAGPFPTSGRNHVRTRLARQWAQRGYHVLRIDYRGIGESAGTPRDIDFNQPFVEDALAACEWLQAYGVTATTLVGYCFGARVALATTPHVGDLTGVALVGAPVRNQNHFETAARAKPLPAYVRRALSPKVLCRLMTDRTSRQRSFARARIKTQASMGLSSQRPSSVVSDDYLRSLEELVKRQVPLLIAYGTADHFYSDFLHAKESDIGHLLDAAGSLAEIKVIDSDVNLQTRLTLQETMGYALTEWLTKLGASSASASAT